MRIGIWCGFRVSKIFMCRCHTHECVNGYMNVYIHTHACIFQLCLFNDLKADFPEAMSAPIQNLISNTIPHSKESELPGEIGGAERPKISL